ncbi:MAG: ATP-binding protein [Acidimicrobiia bacterium]
MELLPRWLLGVAAELLDEEAVILVQGPRAGGKTTLLLALAAERSVDLLDLSDDQVLAIAAQDPGGYVDGLPEPIMVDEYQRLPSLLGVIKRSVDRRPRPGAFVLAGSVTGSLLPQGTETLAGRSHEMTLWGLSQGEIEGRRERFVDAAFDHPAVLRSLRSDRSRAQYIPLVTRGGYPEAVRRERASARRRWHLDYAARVADRDLADLVRLRQPAILRKVLAASAARTAQVLNVTDMAEDLGANRQTVGSYLELLERVFLVRQLPAFSRNLTSRIARHPKLHICDTGLGAALVNLDEAALRRHPAFGPLLESFVVAEIGKQLGWATREATASHFRDRDGHEVDVVLEAADGTVVALEVQAATSVGPSHLRGLRFLADRLGDDLTRGIVLYAGPASIQLGDDPRMLAVPIEALWTIDDDALETAELIG